MGSILFKLNDGSTISGGTVAEVGAIMQRRDVAPMHQDGTPIAVTEFGGGVLFDGYPLNLLLDGVWYPGQQEALKAAGWTIPAQALTLPVVDPAAQSSGFDMQSILKWGVIAAAGYYMFNKL